MRTLVALVLTLSACAESREANPRSVQTDLITERGGWSSGRVGGLDSHVYVPNAQGRSGTGRSLLVALHGCTMSHDDMLNNVSWVDTAERWGMAVALPDVPNGGEWARCWGYYGASHSRSAGTPRQLLALVADLVADPANDIDPDQVYIAGLSSGGGMSMVMGCLAPDVFAGMGIAAGPTLGTSAFEIGQVATTRSSAVGACRRLAGSAAGDFATQMTSVVSGTNDYTVAQGYGDLNIDVMQVLYEEAGTSFTADSVEVSALQGVQPRGDGAQLIDSAGAARLSRLQLDGVGHAWPAGTGAGFGNAFIDPNGLDYAAYLAEWFTLNNPRLVGVVPPVDDPVDEPIDDPVDEPVDDPVDEPVDDPVDPPNEAPAVVISDVQAQGDCVRVAGSVVDDGPIAQVALRVVTTQTVPVDRDGQFASQVCGLASGCYSPQVVVTDEQGLQDTAISEVVAVQPGETTGAETGTIFDHFGRFSSYPIGYGTADTTYPELFQLFGMNTPFTLYSDASGDWFLDPDNAGAAEAIVCE